MGKTKKMKHLKAMRNVPLEKQLDDDNAIASKGRVKNRNRNDDDERFIDPKLSQKILNAARKQQMDMEEEYGTSEKRGKTRDTETIKLRKMSDDDTDDDLIDETGDDADESYYDDIKIEAADERAFEMFMNKDVMKRKTLADYIQEKLKEKETEIETQFSDNASVKMTDIDERVVEMYNGVKLVLSRYRSGKLPKAFKIIPALSNWEQILNITDPDHWTAAAMYQATRIFTSNLKEKMAQRFYNMILLPRLRDDIAEYKRLNFHLYQALRKSLFKSGAFFKGIILPLCESGDCTLREAVIIGSVMSKNHIPLLHSCAAMLKIAEMDYSGATSVFLFLLIKKRYALPYRVIDAIVYHFLKFANDKRTLPILWHQCFLIFVQNYKQDLSGEQKEALMELLRVQSHYQITPVIRNELLNSKCRDEETVLTDNDGNDGNDAMSEEISNFQ